MSLNLNRVLLAGNLTRDVQIRFLASEKAVAECGVAINRRWKDAAGAPHEEVTFVDVEAFGRQAETLAQHLRKGDPVFIEGRLKLDTWEDKQTGQKRSKMKVVLDHWHFVASRRDGDATAAEPPTSAEPPAQTRSRPAPTAPAPFEDPPF